MQFLIDFAEENQEFQRILERASKYQVVQGVVLDLDRSWLLAWQIRQRMGDAFLSRWIEARYDFPFFVGRGYSWDGDEEFSWHPQIYPRPLERHDIETWRPLHWERRQRLFGAREDGPPLVVKVCVRPRTSSKEDYPTVEELKSGEGQLRVEIEPRPQAQLSSDPRKQHRPVPGGVSIGVSAKDFGTLGVILTDANGTYFGLTCSHVAGHNADVTQPARRDVSRAPVVGTSILATSLSACSSTTPCNPWSGVSANELDLSLIKIDSATATTILEVLDIGPLSSVVPRSALSTGQAIEVMARTTRYSALQVGGLAAWYRFHRDGKYYCFKNLFEVESPYGNVGAIRLGDSGAPVCTANESGTGWCGMIVGCDAFKGYAMYSEPAENWLRNNNFNLQLL